MMRRWSICRVFYEGAACGRGSAQTSGVVGHRTDLGLAHFRRDSAHDAVGVVQARSRGERLQLGFGVFRELSRKTRVLGRKARSGSPMAARASGQAFGGVAAPP